MERMDERNYLMKHVKEADRRLRKIAFPYSRNNFTFLDKLTFRTGTLEEMDNALGSYSKANEEIVIRDRLVKKMYKKKYDKELIMIIQHELIHSFIADWFEDLYKFNLKVQSDSCPIFNTFVEFFNARGCSIRVNGTELTYRVFHKDLYELAINKSNKFTTVYKECIKWLKEANNVLEFCTNKIIEETREENFSKIIFPIYEGTREYTEAERRLNKVIKDEKRNVDVDVDFYYLYLGQSFTFHNKELALEEIKYIIEEEFIDNIA